MSNDKINQIIDTYVQSIDKADDTSIAEKVWLLDNRASLIFPLGKEIGWNNIKNNFYKIVMSEKFNSRKLQILNTPEIKLFDNFSLVMFDWQFSAISKTDLSEITTKGRESQIYIKSNDNWKLLHVHYSQL